MAKGIKGSGPKKEDRPVRTSFNIYPDKIKKLRIIAALTGSDMTVLVNEALDGIIASHEKKYGFIAQK